VVEHDDTGAWKQARDSALHDVIATPELTEHDANVALESQQVRQTIDERRRLRIDEHDARRAE